MKKQITITKLSENFKGFSIDVLSSSGNWVTMFELKSIVRSSAITEANELINVWNFNGGTYQQVK